MVFAVTPGKANSIYVFDQRLDLERVLRLQKRLPWGTNGYHPPERKRAPIPLLYAPPGRIIPHAGVHCTASRSGGITLIPRPFRNHDQLFC